MHHRQQLIALLAPALLAGTPLHAFEAMDLQRIRVAAEDTVRSAVPAGTASFSTSADRLDPRLRLAECTGGLHGLLAADGRLRPHTLVAVSCERPVRWTLYVGVTLDSEPVVLRARRPLARGEAPQAADFETARMRVAGLANDYVGDTSQLADRLLRRPLAAGEALALDALSPRRLVRRGEQLTLLSRAGGIEVRVTGIALADGEQDQHIRVQNQSSQRVVEGIVRSVNLVEVPL